MVRAMPQNALWSAWGADMKKTLTIWLFQTGEPLHIDLGNPRPMRAMNLADALIAAGHKVVLWSSAFYHQEKIHRAPSEQRTTVSPQFEIRLVPSSGYQRNIGLGRLWDHAVLAWNLSKLLGRESELPDVAFIGYPPIETAAVMTHWLSKRGVPSMLDVKDQWPTIFLTALPERLQTVGRIALAPYFYFGRRAMRDATALSAMAGGFLQWAADFAGRPIGDLDMVVPLTTPSGQVSDVELTVAREWWQLRGVSADGKPRICLIGSHTTAFDFVAVVEAAKALSSHNSACEFIICGDGPSSEEWRRQAKDVSNIQFVGWVDRAQIEVLAEFSFATLAPYKNTKDFVMSIPNKVIDSLSLGLPVLSPLEGEVKTLIDVYGIGLGYGGRTGRTLAECIDTLVCDPSLRSDLSANAMALYGERFAFEHVYGGLVGRLEVLGRRQSREARDEP
jgi:glycosyltransferase involved in cell wall biosynthesis